MAGWNGSGTFSRTYNWVQDQGNGILIRADRHDANDTDFVNGINNCVAKDGQNTPTADLPMATYKHTGVGNATARTNYAAAGQIQDGGLIWCGTAGGTANALTLTPSPAITAYAAGQRFEFIAGASPNSSTTTVAISGLSTIAVQLGGAALAGGEIQAGKVYRITLDTTSTAQLEAVSEVQSVVTGGTGAQTLTANNVILGNGTSAVQFVAPSTSGNILKSNGTTWESVAQSFGKFGQIQITTKTSTTSTTSDSFTDISGMSVSITPTSSSSTILVIAMVSASTPSGNSGALKLVRDSTDIGIGDASSSRLRATTGVGFSDGDRVGCIPIIFKDSPATTSATTYKLQWRRTFGAGTVYLNQTPTDTDSSNFPRTISSIAVIEILP